MVMHVLATGQYPAEVLEAIDKNSEREGIKTKRLPQLTEKEQEFVKGMRSDSIRFTANAKNIIRIHRILLVLPVSTYQTFVQNRKLPNVYYAIDSTQLTVMVILSTNIFNREKRSNYNF